MAVAATVQRFLAQHSMDYGLISHPHTGSSHETDQALTSLADVYSEFSNQPAAPEVR